MKKTLESFIDPVNIPKKYGGELEFHFGDMPVLDPHLSKVLEWKEGRSDFPKGPMYWVDEKKSENGDESIKAIAVGSIEGGKERKEDVCVVKKELPPLASESSTSEPIKSEIANGHLAAPGAGIAKLRPELLTAPTETDDLPTMQVPETTEKKIGEPETKKEEEKTEVQAGELVPPSRPEPQTFVTAEEGVAKFKDMSLDEKTNGNGGAEGPHQTLTANLLDSNLHVGEKVGEKAAA